MNELGSLKRKRSGQRKCECGKVYNNAKVPGICDVCEFPLGGSYKPQPVNKRIPDSVIISESEQVASVRKDIAGEPVRIFVDLKQTKVIYITYLKFKWFYLFKIQTKYNIHLHLM